MEGRFIAYIPTGAFEKGKGHRVSLVIENEPGHAPTGNTPEGGKVNPWHWGMANDEAVSFKEAEKTARLYNERRGITEKAEMEILISSMRQGHGHTDNHSEISTASNHLEGACDA